MIQFGSFAIADVKLGSRQIAKVCKGSEVIWEKNGMLEMTWGDDFYLPLRIGTSAANSNCAGFVLASKSGYGGLQWATGISQNPQQRTPSMRYFLPPVVSNAYSKPTFERLSYFNTNGTTKNKVVDSSSNPVDLAICLSLPFTAYLQEVRIYDPGDSDTGNAKPQNTIYYRTDTYNSSWESTTVPVKNGAIRTIFDTDSTNRAVLPSQSNLNTWNLYGTINGRNYHVDTQRQFMYYSVDPDNATGSKQTFGNALYDSYTNSQMVDTPFNRIAIDPAVVGKLGNDAYDTPTSNNSTVWTIGYGRIFIRFKVLATDYYAWKAQYANDIADRDAEVIAYNRVAGEVCDYPTSRLPY